MARVTVEDCITKIPNRFELVMVAAQRAKDISSGAKLTVEKDNDKNGVIALREIAEDKISVEDIQKSLVTSMQKYTEIQETEEEELEIIAAEKELADLDEEFLNTAIEDAAVDAQVKNDDEDFDIGDELYEEGDLSDVDDFVDDDLDDDFDDFSDEDDK